MSDFIDMKAAEKLRKKLNRTDKPLAERAMKRGKHGVTAETILHPAIKKTFDLLVKNGYGTSRISEKTPDGEKRLNEFNAILIEGKKDPASIARALSGYDSHTLSQMFYMVNKHAQRDDRYLVEIVESRYLLGVLERAMELGQHRRPG